MVIENHGISHKCSHAPHNILVAHTLIHLANFRHHMPWENVHLVNFLVYNVLFRHWVRQFAQSEAVILAARTLQVLNKYLNIGIRQLLN